MRRFIEEALFAPVGWWNRLFVLIGTAAALLTTNTWWSLAIYLIGWGCLTHQFALSTAYHRGRQYAYRQMADPGSFEQMVESLELNQNRRLVAVGDFARLCAKYGIPPEEAVPIVERGMGFTVIEDDGES